MPKKLSVIIPVYREEKEIILTAVNSVKAQSAYNADEVEIILSLDDPARTLSITGCKTVTCKVNAGPGIARQRGINASSGAWITFIDADDMWFNMLALQQFYNALNDFPNADYMKFPILEENEKHCYHPMELDCTWCFSKFYRREFLIRNEIYFDIYRVHEDSYFVRSVEMCDPVTIEHGDLIYLWRYNENSTVRANDGIYWATSFPTYIDVIYKLAEKKKEKGKGDSIKDNVYNFAYAYAMISRMEEKHRAPCIAALKQWVKPDDLAMLELIPIDVAQQLKTIDNIPNTPVQMPYITYDEFIKLLKEG